MICRDCGTQEAMPSFVVCDTCYHAKIARDGAEQQARIDAYEAERAATMTPEQLAAERAEDERRRRWDRRQMGW